MCVVKFNENSDGDIYNLGKNIGIKDKDINEFISKFSIWRNTRPEVRELFLLFYDKSERILDMRGVSKRQINKMLDNIKNEIKPYQIMYNISDREWNDAITNHGRLQSLNHEQTRLLTAMQVKCWIDE